MTERRRYRLLCPIARALDVLGDRWTLLILRDLHAGPARFQELQEGLSIATNLLSTRLTELTESGMIERSKEAGYQLTEAGRSTDRILWELARFGASLGRDDHPREPGNLRTIALPLRILLESVARQARDPSTAHRRRCRVHHHLDRRNCGRPVGSSRRTCRHRRPHQLQRIPRRRRRHPGRRRLRCEPHRHRDRRRQ